jgi:hypothetical protein
VNSDSPRDEQLLATDEESRAAMRAYLQRSEVRLSTLHRIGQALLGGSALILLLPLFLRDVVPRMLTLLIAWFDAGQPLLPIIAIGVASGLVILLPIPSIFLLIGDLLGFYFTSNTFGAHVSGPESQKRVIFNPRFIIPGLGFNNDELSSRTKQLLQDGRDDEWTRALLVPRSLDDAGWRDRFDTRMFEIWGEVMPKGTAGDPERLRQQFRLAGLGRDRTLAKDVARTEALLARHVIFVRTAVLRYSKALLLLISTTVAMLAASGLIEQAIREDASGGRFSEGFPYRYLLLVAVVFVFWAPLAARSVTAPLRIIDHYTPGIGKHSDVYRDRKTTQYESATIFVTLVVLVAASTALLWAATATGGPGLLVGLLLVSTGVCFWFMALSDYRATPRSTIAAVKLLLRGYDAPSISPELEAERARRDAETPPQDD